MTAIKFIVKPSNNITWPIIFSARRVSRSPVLYSRVLQFKAGPRIFRFIFPLIAPGKFRENISNYATVIFWHVCSTYCYCVLHNSYLYSSLVFSKCLSPHVTSASKSKWRYFHFRSINSSPQFRHLVLTDFTKLKIIVLGVLECAFKVQW